MANKLIEDLIKIIHKKPIRLLLAGPAGVGKSSLACKVAQKFSITHIEHDFLKHSNALCTLHHFDPYGCFSDAISTEPQFVIDIGGGTIFRCDREDNCYFAV